MLLEWKLDGIRRAHRAKSVCGTVNETMRRSTSFGPPVQGFPEGVKNRASRLRHKDQEVCVEDQTAARLILHHLLVKQTGLLAHLSSQTRTPILSQCPLGVDMPPYESVGDTSSLTKNQ